MQVIKPPNSIIKKEGMTIFLAGSIENGVAENWQAKAEKIIYIHDNNKKQEVIVYNPRREDWDPTWKQDSPQMKNQVRWELNALSKCDYILMYFDPSTKSPISLLEFGLYAKSHKMVVVCPEGFYRKTNVDVVCNIYHIKQFLNIEDAVLYLFDQRRLGKGAFTIETSKNN